MLKVLEYVNKRLKKKHKTPHLGNKKNPLNELLYIQLSLRTTGPSFERVYLEFKNKFPKWDDVYKASKEEIALTTFKAGLSNQKASNLKSILNKLYSDFGKVSLSPIKRLNDGEIEIYLRSFAGIGKKAARCIMLYSFDRKVFPVDSHCFRIIKRLGWIKPDERYNDKIADEIQDMIPPELRYSLHVNMVAHGRAICLERYPKCNKCPIFEFCIFGKRRILTDQKR